MQPMTIPEIISAVDGTWLNPRKGAAPVTAVCTDCLLYTSPSPRDS